MNTISAAAAH